MNERRRAHTDDPFLLSYNAADLGIASEFLSNWLPFLSSGLCHRCTQTLSGRIRSLDPETDRDAEPLNGDDNANVSTRTGGDLNEYDGNQDNCDAHSLGWKDIANMNDTEDTNSLGSWKDGANGCSEIISEASTSERTGSVIAVESSRVKMSWADMAQEDNLEMEANNEANKQLVTGKSSSEEMHLAENIRQKQELPREQREHIRFSNVKRKKDFICLERVNGKIVNILDGLELHNGVFSVAEQKRIVDFVYALQDIGKKGELKACTYTMPQKRMVGKRRETIQFGCCYNYATDKNGNPPGILRSESGDPLPPLFKVIIRRLVTWHVLPPYCVPDSCIVNIYEEGDCFPPHIDNHDFVRPFCTVSFLSECNMVFGSNIKVIGPGKFSGSVAIPLPPGSILVLNGNGANIAKHCVPSVSKRRISITFRKMDESKWPIGYVPEPYLQGLQPLSYESDRSKKLNHAKHRSSGSRQTVRREDNSNGGWVSAERGSKPHYSGHTQQGHHHNLRRVW